MAGPYDSRIIAYLGEGVAASRPASLNIASTALGIYYATDTKTLSLWNGSGWDTLIALASAIAAGVVSSNGTVLEGTTLGAGLSWSSDTLSNTGVLQIGTDAGTIHVGGGLSEASGTLSNTGVLVFGGVTGTVTLGAGVSMAGQTLSATGSGGSVTAVAAGTGLEVGSGPGGTITTSGTLLAWMTAATPGVIIW